MQMSKKSHPKECVLTQWVLKQKPYSGARGSRRHTFRLMHRLKFHMKNEASVFLFRPHSHSPHTKIFMYSATPHRFQIQKQESHTRCVRSLPLNRENSRHTIFFAV